MMDGVCGPLLRTALYGSAALVVVVLFDLTGVW